MVTGDKMEFESAISIRETHFYSTEYLKLRILSTSTVRMCWASQNQISSRAMINRKSKLKTKSLSQQKL